MHRAQAGIASGPTRPARAKFVIKPYHDGRLDAPRAEAFMAALRSGFRSIREKRAQELNFSHLYNMAYKLVLWKQGERLYDMCTELLRRASLCTRHGAFTDFGVMVRDVTMYSERTYILINHRVPIKEYAKGIYARDVARRWRRVRHVAVKGTRIVRWRAAFDEARFRPGGSGWVAARESFHAHASA